LRARTGEWCVTIRDGPSFKARDTAALKMAAMFNLAPPLAA
jgi:hypothetical protein